MGFSGILPEFGAIGKAPGAGRMVQGVNV